MKTFGVNFRIGAGLGSGFSPALGSASRTIKGLGAEIKGLEKVQATAGRFADLKRGLGTTRLEMQAAQAEASRLAGELKNTSKPTKKLQQDFARAQNRAHQLKEKLAEDAQELQRVRGGLAAAGFSTRTFRQDTDRLTKSIERAKKAQSDLAIISKKQQANQARRSELQGKMTGAAIAVGAMAAPLVQSAQIQESEIRLSTVINATDQGLAMAKAKTMAQAIARSGLSSYADAYNAQYALNSAGLSADASRAASLVVAKVAKVTSGVPETVGEVIATTYNNLGKSLTGTTEQKMARIGDLLTKVQFKYQIRDFGQLGESLKEGAAGMANYNVSLAQGVTLIGQLNSAGLQGGRAGTAMNATLRQLGKAQKEWGIEIVRTKNGELDMISTLEGIRNALDSTFGDDLDARAQAIQKVFGDEGARGLVPLLGKIDELKAGFKDVEEGSRGLTDREVVKFTSSSIGQFNAMTGSLTVAADGFSRTLLPGVNAAMGGLASGAQVIASVSEKFPPLTNAITFTAAGLVGLHAAGIAARYAGTFLTGGWLNAVKIFKVAQMVVTWNTAALMNYGFVSKGVAIATNAWTGAQWLLNAAMTANPIGLVIAGAVALGAAAYFVYSKWEPIKAFFVGIGNWFSSLSWYDSGKKLVSTLASGIWDAATLPYNAAKTVLGKVRNLLPFSDAKEGPLSQLTLSGRKIMETMAGGVAMGGNPLRKQVSGSLSGVSPAIPGGAIGGSAGGGGGISITVSPVIHIGSGASGDVRSHVDQAMQMSEARLREMIERIMLGNRRLSYGN